MFSINKNTVEKFDFISIRLVSDKEIEGNPFTEVDIKAQFINENKNITKVVDGFYDGDNTWEIRFMPEEVGVYQYKIISNIPEFNGIEDTFECVPNTGNNHGYIKVINKKHFSFADGNLFYPMGTTAYVWTLADDENRKKSIESFEKYNFNKIRMLFFPKHYSFPSIGVDISYDSEVWPFEGEPGNFNFKKPNPIYFRNFEKCILDLMEKNIQADVILFHPYDKWGISSKMTTDDIIFYLKYIVVRFSAFRNIWWSLANEYNLLPFDLKTWDLIGSYIRSIDPYNHLISVHNFPMAPIFPDRNWLTHVSYQHPNTYNLLIQLKEEYNKPVINDEYQYEGNINSDWGNSSAETVVFRHWLSAMAGGYATHGEVFVIDNNKKDLFWSYGGNLIGESPKRLKFMKEIIESCPYQEMDVDYINTDGHNYFSLCKNTDFYLIFCRYNLPGKYPWIGRWDKEEKYEATFYNVWNCKVIDKRIIKSGIFTGDKLDFKEWTVIKLVKKK